ncbi:MAG TPA: ABC transporter permease [Gemmatimonadales bacterium]|jgi:phospholipid/cholesterol/gamma-HCH transport system permease protein|nr:ABC transporter permease [Gemmatimonadales bacterium]
MASRALGIDRLIGNRVLDGASHVGRLTYFVLDAIRGLAEVKIWWPRAMVEAWNIGVGSLFIVLLISSFAGAVTALQTGYQFTGRQLPYYVVGTLVVSSIVLELGPVLTALILAGRIGARYAAELGTMRVTEQIDALESLGRSPSSHLVVPRVLAGLIMIPTLTILANVTGILAGWISVKLVLPVTDADFTYGAQSYWRPWDAWYSVIKSFFFAGSITVISCYMGFSTQQGAEGVGKSTTGAVVISSVLILLLDTVLTRLLLNQ